jgi:hypothetical protein
MLERLLILHACLQSIGFLLVNNQLPLCGIGESPMLEHSSIVPKPVQLLQLLVLVLVEVSELVALEPVVEVLAWFQLVASLAVLQGLELVPVPALEPVVVSLLVVLIQIV